jgi:hypothetical protein
MRERSASFCTSLTTAAALDSPCEYAALMRCASAASASTSKACTPYLRATSPTALRAGCEDIHSV